MAASPAGGDSGTGPLPSRFDLLRELGSGATGIVYEAFDRELSRRVAVKVFHDRSLDTDDRVKREFRVAAAVRHPALVRLGELFEHDDSLCFSMELVDGTDVIAWTRADPHARVRIALRQIAGALAALHAAGVVHRDVKPSNLLVAAVPESAAAPRIVLLDLGLAVPIARRERALAGTVDYVAPEQVDGRPAAPAADLYGLGVVAFEALTGRTPFAGTPAEILVAKLHGEAPPVRTLAPDAPPALEALIASLLARDPAARPSARDVEAMLDSAPPRRVRRPSSGHAPRLHGRDDELAALLAATDEPVRDRTVLYLVHGAAGVGKTALLDAFARAATARGHLVCTGRCAAREHLHWNAWEGLVDGIAHHLAALPAAERDALLPPDAAAITRLFPSFARAIDADGVRSAPVDELVAEGVAAMRSVLRRLGATRRVISIVDDAQWATEASFALLLDTLAAPSPPLLLVFCVRTAPSTPAARARTVQMRGLPVDFRLLEVTPLGDADAIALATQLTGDAAVGARVGRAARGVPLFVEQLAAEPDAGGADLPAVLERRVAALPADVAPVMRLVAAAGGPVAHDVLGRALGAPHDAVARAIELLVDRVLVRVTGVTRTDTCEPLHELVIAATRAAASDPALRHEHRRLALAIEDGGDPDPAARVHHWTAAGEGDRAAAAAIAAVDAARDGVGFTRAVALCDLAAQLASRTHGARLARRRADALAGAGAGVAAAEAYAAAAARATGADALDLERLAAEHFLRGARVDDGLVHAGRVADALGLPLATGAGTLLGRIAVERIRNRWRGLELAPSRARGASSEPAGVVAAEAQAADACYSLSIGLSMTDTVRAAWFTSRGVRHALASGDAARAARALGLEASLIAARGVRVERRARETLAQARALAARSGDRRTLALGEHAATVVALVLGDFRGARRHADQTIALFKDGVAGVAFEQHTAQFFGAVAAFWLGEWSDTARRLRALVRAADATGDRFARTCATTGVVVIAELVRGVPADELHARVDDAARQWPPERAPSAHMRALSSAVTIDLYHGEAAAAAARLDRAWPLLVKTRALDVEQARMTLLGQRARARLRLGRLDDALADARAMRAVPWSAGPAALIEAAVAHARGADPAPALDLAVRACEEAGLAAFTAAARDRRARVRGGDAGAAERLAAHDLAARLGLGPIDRAFALLAPWD